MDQLAIRIILFGPIVQKAIISRICSTLSINLMAGIPLIEALNRVARVSNNQLFYDALLQVRELVLQGESVSLAMKETFMFPAMVSQMVEIGEKAGSLDHMLDTVGSYYREQVNSSVEGLTTIIEPLLIMLIGGIIGVFIFAMYLPIFNLGLAIK
ncbi:MAG: General secretion pathway protein F [uncultured bacterium]|nr:MAG: General secretion pathway protein F [uncultured bacterium]